MRNTGNNNANLEWNPKNTRPPVPLDADEVDSSMERFIRLKYEQKAYTTGGSSTRAPLSPMPTTSSGANSVRSYPSPMPPASTGGTASSDDNPPPPPPKPGRRFGFGLRSASSVFPLGKSGNDKKGANVPPLTMDKERRFFGAAIGITESDKGLEWKLLQLKEMGFSDESQNSSVLKGHNGDLEQTIASLIRLGESSSTRSVRKPGFSSTPSRQNTPSLPEKPITFGASVTASRPTQQSQQQTQQSTPSTARSNNPFDNNVPVASPAQSAFESAFANMSVSQPSTQQQSLFPNATGGYQGSQAQVAQPLIQQSMTPPVPQLQQPNMFNNPYAQAQQSYNPIMSPQQPMSPPHSASNPYSSSQQGMTSPNPFVNQPNIENNVFSPSPSYFQQQQQPQQQWLQTLQSAQLPPEPQWVQSPQYAQHQPSLQSPTQLFGGQTLSPTFQSPQFTQQDSIGQFSPSNPYQQQNYLLMAQPTGRIDNSTIMNLYNYPHLAPTPVSTDINSNQNSTGPSPQLQAAMVPPTGKTPQRSVTMPVLSNRNPFANAGNAPSVPAVPPSNGAWPSQRESIDSGRQSPDAFASLSARFVR